MNRQEKNRMKSEINEHIDLSNGRFKDDEVERLYSLMKNRESYDGVSNTYRDSYKAFDSEGTYHVKEQDTYTLRTDNNGVRIDRDFTRDWDDGQHDEEHYSFCTGREILNNLGKVLRGHSR